MTVNGSGADTYDDETFAKAGYTLVDGKNSFTAVGYDSYGRVDTNIATAYLPASPVFAYDLNGNLLSDGLQAHGYDGENQLTNILVTNIWQAVFQCAGALSRNTRGERDVGADQRSPLRVRWHAGLAGARNLSRGGF